VRHAEVDQARFLASRYDLDWKSERASRLLQKSRGVLGDAQRIGADGTHCVRIEAAQALAEAIEAFERALLRILVELLVAREAAAEADGLAQGIEGVELVADDARYLQVKRVRSEIDCGKRGIYRHS
jgi:hypothetical protein